MSTKKLQIIGGNFGGSSIQTDDTLTKVGHAADAKATGDAINQLQTNIDEVARLVGDTPVSEQITNAIEEFEDATIAYVDEKFAEIPEFDPKELQDAIDANTAAIDTKVDKVDGKGLSTNDYTTSEKDKLSTVEDYANFYEHPAHDSHDLGLYKVTVDGEGHVSSAALVEKEDIVALGIPAQDTTYEEEISDLSDRIDDVENNINTTNETLTGLSQEFENYKTTNNEAVATNASGIEANKTAIEEIQSDYLTSTDKTQLQDDIKKVSDKATANEAAIEILNGEGDGSVKQSIDNAFNEFAANVTNDDVVNTYKELIDYAAKHGPEFTALVGKVDTIDTHVGEIETDLSNYKTTVSEQFIEVDTTINDHIVDENNPHNVTKDQIGLDQVDNTSDLDKPISNAVDEALQGKADLEHMHGIIEVDSLQELLDELQAGIDTNATNIDTKADLEHNHDDLYYDKEEIMGMITVDDIDDICESVQGSDEIGDLIKVATTEWVHANYQLKGNYLTAVPDGYATEGFVENKIAESDKNIASIREDIGDVNDLQTVKKNLTSAVNEVLTSIDTAVSESSITLTSKGASDNFSNVYELKQGDNVIGHINIIKDMVVKSGEVVDIDGVKNIKLVLQNIDTPLYIPVGSLVDVYVAKADAAQVQVVVDSNTREISAHIVSGSVTADELATNAVVTTKIADANVTKAKLSAEVQVSLEKANVSEKNAMDYADSLDDAMDVRVSAIETKLIDIGSGNSHEHANKDELDLIISGDKAKWDNAATDLYDEIARAIAADETNATEIANAKIELRDKISSVAALDSSIIVAGSSYAPIIAVNLSQDDDNSIELSEDGLKVVVPTVSEYTIQKIPGTSEYDSTYMLMKDGIQVGASINIPKNMVIKSGCVVDGNIVLVLNDEDNTEIVIPTDSLIEHAASGSVDGDAVVIDISDDYKISASITDGSITTAKLSSDVLFCLNMAHSHENFEVLKRINSDKVAAWDSFSIEPDLSLSVEGQAADAKAVGDALNNKQDIITGIPGQFVIIGDDGKLTTKSISNAEGVEF